MKSDLSIKKDVLDELAWQPNVDETQIGVTVENGVVTLTGTVNSYAKKIAAEKAVKNVKGVRAVAEDIEVKYGEAYKKTDKEIAKAAANALKWNYSVPENNISLKVEDGRVHLTGEVDWLFQKEAAEETVEDLLGVEGVSNKIKLKEVVTPSDIRDRITKAFERSARIDAKSLDIAIDGHTVKLNGKVSSLAEKNEARKAAYYAPGVNKVENNLEISY